MDLSGRSPEPRRAGARILDTAEGVLIALRGCSLNQAFVEIVQTAKRHNVSTHAPMRRRCRRPGPTRYAARREPLQDPQELPDASHPPRQQLRERVPHARRRKDRDLDRSRRP